MVCILVKYRINQTGSPWGDIYKLSVSVRQFDVSFVRPKVTSKLVNRFRRLSVMRFTLDLGLRLRLFAETLYSVFGV